MPTKVTTIDAGGGTTYVDPFLPGDSAPSVAIPITVSGLTSAEVDAYGFLKPGVGFQRNGTLPSALTGQTIFGVTTEAIKVAKSNAAGDLAAAGTPEVALRTRGDLNRAIMESNLGRVLTANELAIYPLSPWFRLIA
jgi:hypothetical protein